MKKLLAAALAASMALSMAVVSSAAYGDTFKSKDGKEDLTYSDFFNIDEYAGHSGGTLTPGQTYYFPCTWSNDPMTDEFFEIYNYSVSILSGYDRDDDDYKSFSNSSAKSRVDVAEFEKGSDGKYYFKFRAKPTFSYTEDAPITVAVFAKDKQDSDYRGYCELNLSVGYSYSNSPHQVGTTPWEVDRDSPMLEFDEDLRSIRLEFDEGSYYNFTLSTKARKFNFLYTDDPDAAIVNANQGARLKFLAFPPRPQIGGNGVLKIYAPGAKYLYAIDEQGALTQLSNDNNNDFFGVTVDRLGSYVASDIPLKAASASPAPPPESEQESAGRQTGAGGVPADSLSALVSRSFGNRFVTFSYGSGYKAVAGVTLRAGVDLSALNSSALRVYVYNPAANQFIELAKANPKVGSDGSLTFTTTYEGQFVVTDAPLTAK